METLTMQDGIQHFIGSLSSVQVDQFVRVMGRLEALGAQAELSRLQGELNEVKKKIEEVNRRRDQLRLEKQDLCDTVDAMDNTPNCRSYQDLVQLRLMLCNLISELDEKIAASRPVELHEAKARIKRDLMNRRLLADLGGMLRSSASSEHGD